MEKLKRYFAQLTGLQQKELSEALVRLVTEDNSEEELLKWIETRYPDFPLEEFAIAIASRDELLKLLIRTEGGNKLQ